MKIPKFKKWHYATFIFILLNIIAFYWADNELVRIMGKSTEVIDASTLIKPSETIFIKNVNVLSEDCSVFIPNQNLVLKDGKIISFSEEHTSTKSTTTIIDGTNKYLIPGLVDSHVHLNESKNDLLLYLVNGVTYVREMSGRPITLDWKKSLEYNGIGPRMFVSSPPIYSESGINGYYYGWTRKAINYSNAKDARKAIENLSEMGYDAIKMYSFVNPEMFQATIDIAKENNIIVIGHIPKEIKLDSFYSSGQKEIAHIEELTKKTMESFGRSVYKNPDDYIKYLNEHADEIAKKVYENKLAVTSTIWLMESIAEQAVDLEEKLKTIQLKYVNPTIIEGTVLAKLGWLPTRNGYEKPEEIKNNSDLKAKEIKFWDTYAKATGIVAKALIKNNVNLLAGTDANVAGVVAGFSLHDELASLNKSGLTNSEVLYSATVAPNEWMQSNSGKIKLGYNSDLVLLSKNPLVDIKNTKAIDYVFFNKYFINKSQINNILNSIEFANNKNRKVNIEKFVN